MASPALHCRARGSSLLAPQHHGLRQRGDRVPGAPPREPAAARESHLPDGVRVLRQLSGGFRQPAGAVRLGRREQRSARRHGTQPSGGPTPSSPRRASPDVTTAMPAAGVPQRRAPLTAAGPGPVRRPTSPGAGTQGLQKGADLRGKGKTARAGPGRAPRREETAAARGEYPCGGSAAEGGRGHPQPIPPPSILRRSAAARLALPAPGPEAFIAGGGRYAPRSPPPPAHLPAPSTKRLRAKAPLCKHGARTRACPKWPGEGFGKSVLIALEQTHGCCRGARPCGNGAGGGGRGARQHRGRARAALPSRRRGSSRRKRGLLLLKTCLFISASGKARLVGREGQRLRSAGRCGPPWCR